MANSFWVLSEKLNLTVKFYQSFGEILNFTEFNIKLKQNISKNIKIGFFNDFFISKLRILMFSNSMKRLLLIHFKISKA